MATVVGSGVLFGCGTTSVTIAGLATLIQSTEVSGPAEEERIKDSSGNTKAVAYSDHSREARLEFVPTAGTNTGTLTVTASVMPSAGTTLAVTDAQFIPIAGTWVCRGEPEWTGSNSRAMMARINLIRFLPNSIPS
jgi:hypothetical protein